MKSIKNNAIRQLTERILAELKDLNPYLYHVSRWDSVYIKFKDQRLCSVRIGDHNGREKYKYKWNLEIGGSTRIETDEGTRRFYFSDKDIDAFFSRIRQYNNTIQQNNALLNSVK